MAKHTKKLESRIGNAGFAGLPMAYGAKSDAEKFGDLFAGEATEHTRISELLSGNEGPNRPLLQALVFQRLFVHYAKFWMS
ncbi:hypothetical protein E2F49_03840 [Luteimonas terrae]|uniref:Uncharacterized protein n=1 Tax=Luteimonas terrae TaxID=1530191 RepID=A0A4V3ANV9_9GAMM|nr:hypothetical protein [Luteimonas terrae]TDK33182.1 hypothetical protein E2F49_03840 [Luteimonas terrae]